MPFVSRGTSELAKYVRLVEHKEEDGTICLVFGVSDPNVPPHLWKLSMQELTSFVTYIRENNLRYHFVFDIHECTTIPVQQLYELMEWLRENRAFLLKHLHSSVIITSNRVVEMILNTALTVFPAARPFRICWCDGERCPTDERGIPAGLWETAHDFFEKNRLQSGDASGTARRHPNAFSNA